MPTEVAGSSTCASAQLPECERRGREAYRRVLQLAVLYERERAPAEAGALSITDLLPGEAESRVVPREHRVIVVAPDTRGNVVPVVRASERRQRRTVPRQVGVESTERAIPSNPNQRLRPRDLAVVGGRVEVREVDVVGRPDRRTVDQEDEVVRIEVVHVPTLEGQVERLTTPSGQLELRRPREQLDVHVQADVPQVRLHDLTLRRRRSAVGAVEHAVTAAGLT